MQSIKKQGVYRRMDKYDRVHPYTMWEKMSRFSFLLLIPLTEPLLSRPQDIPSLLSSMGMNLFALLLFILWAAAETRAAGYAFLRHSIRYKRGFFVHHRGVLPADSVCSVLFKETLIPSLFGAARFYADTPAGNKKHADLALTLSRKKMKQALEEEIYKQNTHLVYKARMWRILLMAASWSNPAAGLLLLAPLVNRAGKILGEEINARLYSTVDKTLHLAAWGIPPLAAGLGNLLAAGWAAAMLAQMVRYSNFKVFVSSEYLFIQRGVIARSRQLLRRRAITALSIRQTLVMRLLGLSCCYMHTAQGKKHKGDRSLLFAVQKQKSLEQQMQALFSFPGRPVYLAAPPKRALFSYILIPLLGILFFIFTAFVPWLLGQKSRIFPLISAFAIAVLLWWLAVRVLAHKTSGLSREGDILLLRSYYKVTLQTMAIPVDMIQQIAIRQNPFQKRYGRCSVDVYLFSESKEVFTVRQLEYAAVRDILDKGFAGTK